MIPKRAFFIWGAGAMSWLRRQTVESFKRLNPSWEIELVRVAGESSLRQIQNTDCHRYSLLHERGGLYFDTDIAFRRPVPDKWLQGSVLVPVTDSGTIGHIAMLGGVPGNEPFRILSASARGIRDAAHDRGVYLNYQQLGVQLINRFRDVVFSSDCVRVPMYAVCPVPWNETQRLWNPAEVPFADDCIGVHWYGGDPLSREVEPDCDPKWAETSQCPVAVALQESMQ